MIKLHRKPGAELHHVSTFLTLGDLPKMDVFCAASIQNRYYIHIVMDVYDVWWRVSAKELSDENETDTYINAMKYFGVFLRRKTSEERLKELGLLI